MLQLTERDGGSDRFPNGSLESYFYLRMDLRYKPNRKTK